MAKMVTASDLVGKCKRMATLEIRRMTLDEFQALPEGPPYFEFEEEVPIPMTSPSPEHQELLALLFVAVRQFVLRNRLGRVVMEVDVTLPDGQVYIPDLAFVSAERLTFFSARGAKIHGAPDLVVELLSTDEARDRIHKFQVYYDNGVEWYWIISPQMLTVEEYHATPQGYVRVSSTPAGALFRPQRFPGLALDLQALLATEAEAQTERGLKSSLGEI